MPEFSFDASSMDALHRDLLESAHRFRVETDKTLVEVGVVLKEAAKEAATAAGSSSIPPTVKDRTEPGSVIIEAGSDTEPLAALWDLGNSGRGQGRKKTFKHPVFGNKNVWVEQARHPVLKRARTVSRPAITKLMNRTWDRVLEPLTRG